MNDVCRRHHFLTKAFALAAVRAAAAAGVPAPLPSVDEPYPPELARV
jgi:hypothetical protein